MVSELKWAWKMVLLSYIPIEDTPAFKAGLQSGDLIIKLDDKSTKGMSLNDAVKIMRGKPGTSLNVQILRKGQDVPFDVKITRAQIKSQSVKAKLIQEDYGYIRVTQFQERTGGCCQIHQQTF